MTHPRIVYCHCAYAQVVPEDVKAQVLRGLSEAGVPFEAVADLCEMAARRDPAMQDIADGTARIAACYPRAVRGLFTQAGHSLPADGVQIVNMRTCSGSEAVASLLDGVAATVGAAE